MRRLYISGPASGWAFVACLALVPFGAAAGEPAKKFLDWKPLSTAELAKERGANGLANNDQLQYVDNDLTANKVKGGAVDIGQGALSKNTMTVNILNTGNNSVLQASQSFVVNLTQ